MTETSKITLQGRLYAAIQSFAAVKDVRYYLSGVHVVCNEHTVTLEATDGYKAVRYAMDAPEGMDAFDVIVPLAKVGKTKPVSLTLDHGRVTFEQDGKTWIETPVDERYPDVTRVIPGAEQCSGEQAAFNPGLLASIYTALAEIGKAEGMRYVPVRLHHNGQGAALLTANALPHVKAVIMPMRD